MDKERARRVEPVTEPPDADIAALLESGATSSGLGVVPDFHRVIANHPEVLRRITGLGLGRLPDGELTVRQRELLVLRTARHCQATYEWAHHRRRAAERGLTDADVRVAWDGAAAAAHDTDRALLAAADELHRAANLCEDTWAALHDAVGIPAAIEAITVVGWFHLIAFLGNSLGLEVEPGVDDRFGPPGGLS